MEGQWSLRPYREGQSDMSGDNIAKFEPAPTCEGKGVRPL